MKVKYLFTFLLLFTSVSDLSAIDSENCREYREHLDHGGYELDDAEQLEFLGEVCLE